MSGQTKNVDLKMHFTEPPGVTVSDQELKLLVEMTMSFFQHGLELIVKPKLPKPKGDPNPNAQ